MKGLQIFSYLLLINLEQGRPLETFPAPGTVVTIKPRLTSLGEAYVNFCFPIPRDKKLIVQKEIESNLSPVIGCIAFRYRAIVTFA